MSEVIACDLGSNTLRIVQWNCSTFTRVKEFEKIVRTAEGLHRTGIISNDSIARILKALEEASLKFDFKNIPTISETTEAMRRARNRTLVLGTIKSRYGLNFRIIDPKEEAFLTRLGVESALEMNRIDASRYYLFDLGGGSMEITCKEGANLFCRSFPIGVVTLAGANPNLESFSSALTKELLKVQRVINTWPSLPLLIGVGGTATTLASFSKGNMYDKYDAKTVTGTVLSKEDCKKFISELLAMPFELREQWIGVGRSNLMNAGVKILTETMSVLGFDKITVVDDGLREGTAIAFCNNLPVK